MHEADQQAALRTRVDAVAPDGTLVLMFHSLAAIMDGGQWNALRLGHYAYYSTPGDGRHAGRAGHDRHLRAPVPAVRRHGGAARPRAAARTRPLWPSCSPPSRPRGSRTRHAVGALGEAVARTVTALRARLEEHRAAGRRVYGYAAASRAVSLLLPGRGGPHAARRRRRRLARQARKAHAGHRRAGDRAGGARRRGARTSCWCSSPTCWTRCGAPCRRSPPTGGWTRASPRPARCAPARWCACARRSAAPSPAARAAGPGAASPAAAARSRPARPRRSAR